MNLAEYKAKAKELEVRQAKIQKEYDRQQVIYEQEMAKLKDLGIDDFDEVDEKIEELEKKIKTVGENLETFLTGFENKIKAIEELLA